MLDAFLDRIWARVRGFKTRALTWAGTIISGLLLFDASMLTPVARAVGLPDKWIAVIPVVLFVLAAINKEIDAMQDRRAKKAATPPGKVN